MQFAYSTYSVNPKPQSEGILLCTEPPVALADISRVYAATIRSSRMQRPYTATIRSKHTQQPCAATIRSNHTQQPYAATVRSDHTQQPYAAISNVTLTMGYCRVFKGQSMCYFHAQHCDSCSRESYMDVCKDFAYLTLQGKSPLVLLMQ